MAIQVHHLALLPACRRHSRRQKAHRDLTRMIEHLESHESEWVETPMASRNKSLLKKWKEQIKVTDDESFWAFLVLQSQVKLTSEILTVYLFKAISLQT